MVVAVSLDWGIERMDLVVVGFAGVLPRLDRRQE